jgi:hypothetical protein
MCRLEGNIKMDLKEIGREAELLATEPKVTLRKTCSSVLSFMPSYKNSTATELHVPQWKGCI